MQPLGFVLRCLSRFRFHFRGPHIVARGQVHKLGPDLGEELDEITNDVALVVDDVGSFVGVEMGYISHDVVLLLIGVYWGPRAGSRMYWVGAFR